MEIIVLLLCAAIGVTYYVFTKKLQEVARSAKHEQDRLLFMLQKYDGLRSKEEFEKQLDSNIQTKEAEITAKQVVLNEHFEEQKSLQLQINKLRLELGELEEESYIQSFGFYQPKYSFINAGDYYVQLKQVRDRQREMHRADEAAVCRNSWVVGNSEKDGKKLAKNFLKLILTIFNGECENIISKVKPSNVSVSEEKVKKHFRNLNKSGQVLGCEITEAYLALRLKELHLQYEYECKRQEEKEQEQELNARMKQEVKERRMLEEELKRIQEAEEKEKTYQQQLKEALLKRDAAAAQDKQVLENQIYQLREHLAEATKGREEAERRSRLIKAGYVYVISNIGSLGRDIYRICITKREASEEYIRNMNPYVPFPFDVHFKFISEDASDTLRRLHQRFDDRRVNAVNLRREFFRVSFEEISQAIEEIQKETGALKNIQSERSPQAYEYRRTRAAESIKGSSEAQAADIGGKSA
jgi:hypothetical protein